MHPVHAVEDGEHKRKREDELDLSIREGAEGECATPQNRARPEAATIRKALR